jgi:membrane-associated phospholipid phosphatase
MASGSMTFLPGRRYMATGRDLAEYVHRDFSYEAFLHAALMLLGRVPASPDNPYLDPASANQAPFSTFGGPHVLDLVAHAANLALRAAWYQKLSLHRRLRPEAMGGLVHGARALGWSVPINPELLNAGVLDRVSARFGSFLLPMAYPEGCPTHPSYPAGHAAIAGACTTVLKIFFDEAAVLANPVVPDSAGQTLQPYDGPPLTVGGELNKLASNIALGRDVAGVHYRSDGAEGLLLGEAVAVGIVRDTLHCYSERLTEFSFTSFDGTRVVIAS